MLKNLILLITIAVFFLFTASTAFADSKGGPSGNYCAPGIDTCCSNDPPYTAANPCKNDGAFDCMPGKLATGDTHYADGRLVYQCLSSTVGKTFGKIQPPPSLANLIKDNPSGAWVISMFLSNFILLLFSIAAVVLILMIIWAAFEWMTSGGDKEHLANAQKRLINAFIGIVLFAAAFAIIKALGTITGFTFFNTP